MPSIVWKGHLTLGLVSIPVKLFRAARKERVRLHYVHRPAVADREAEEASEEDADQDNTDFTTDAPIRSHVLSEPTSVEHPAPISRVRQSLVSASGEQPLSREEVFRGYEIEPDRYVVLDQDELRGIRRRTSAMMEIVRSVRLSEIDPVFLDCSYYVAPGAGGEKAYALLFAALRETGRVALARVGMHGREHVVIVRPGERGLLAHTMYYMDEIRFQNEFRTDIQSVGGKELELARTFLEAIEAPFAPEEFKDAYREELQALIAQKVEESAIAVSVSPTVAIAPAVDIIEALRKSIAMKTKKPPVSEKQPRRMAPGRTGEIKEKRRSRKAR